VFVCGEQPLWLLALRGSLVAHAMDIDGAVHGFTPFHNINCPRVGPCLGDPLGTQGVQCLIHRQPAASL
jgi:hypothetical protein